MSACTAARRAGLPMPLARRAGLTMPLARRAGLTMPLARRAGLTMPLARRAGLTMVELVVASGLLTLIFVALFSMLEDFLSLWERSEARRAAAEETSGVLELMAADLAAPEAGGRGDLLAEWVRFDRDGDGVRESAWPRLRVVRQASPAELQRLIGPPGAAGASVASEESGSSASGGSGAPDDDRPLAQGLVEVVWTVLPVAAASSDADLRAQGFLWRGERVFGPDRGSDVSFFSERYISESGLPRPGSVEEVTGGVLWLGLRFASQTSDLRDGWVLGSELADVRAAWDARELGRADPDHPFNEHAGNEHAGNEHAGGEPAAGRGAARARPTLPRRVRLELELEHPRDLPRRTRLGVAMELEDAVLRVDDPERLPSAGAHVLVEGEWLELIEPTAFGASVRRGARGSTPAPHPAGALVHYGRTVLREVPVITYREDWDL